MPLYAYKGIGPNGKSVQGVRDADTPKTLRQVMRREGVVVTDVSVSKGKGTGAGKGLNKDVNLGELLSRVRKAEVAGFTRQLATLLRAGIPLAEALGALFDQAENVKFKAILGDVKSDVNEGSSLADALAKHGQVYDDLYVSMVRAGETAGNLDDVLSRLADFMESSAALKSKVQGAMIYPVIMVVVGVIIMAVLMVAVVPKITDLFASQGVSLPATTRLLIWVADLVGAYWLLMLLLAVGGVFAFRAWTKTESGRHSWHMFALKMPLVGPLVRQVAVSRFARTVGTMLEAGVPMLRVLDTSKEVLGNVVLVNVVEDAKHAVTEGESLAVTLRRSGHFPASVTHMIAVGERSGALEQMLLRVAEAYDQEIDMKLTRLTGMLEPLMLVVMGGAVAFVVFSILMPMMEMQKLTGL